MAARTSPRRPPAGAAATPSATSAARAEAETESRTKPGSEARPEAGPEIAAAGLLVEVFEELAAGLPPGAVQGAPLRGPGNEAESEPRPVAERSLGCSEWIAHGLCVLTCRGIRAGRAFRNITIYRKLTRCNEMFRQRPVRDGVAWARGPFAPGARRVGTEG
ncbi:hypothetical protein MHEI_23420 [Mycobacterium heidelbergense]|nr:hypothetical protein MHEI_23420 [Mycobacterium heidelbergense]